MQNLNMDKIKMNTFIYLKKFSATHRLKVSTRPCRGFGDVGNYKFCLADHARLQLDLSYNWHFEIKDQNNLAEASKIFNVADFVGDLCKAMASKIRGAVSTVTFDDFHKNSAKIIQLAAFGTDPETRQVRLGFPI